MYDKNEEPQRISLKAPFKLGDVFLVYISETEITVRYAETDRMGIVHHSRYYPWFEAARGDFIKKFGIKYSEMEEMGILMPLTETHAKYIRGVTYEDEVIVTCKLVNLGVAKCTFEYEVIKKDDGMIVTKGSTVHGFVDKDFVPLNLKKKHYDIWKKMADLMEK